MIERSKKSPTLTEQVYEELLNKLTTNEYMPGDILNRRVIAKELEVSPAPVLDALRQLSMEGFVEIIPRKGTIVKAVKREDVYDQHIMREAIECQAARLYCGGPVRRELDRLKSLAETIDKAMVAEEDHWQQEIEFHRLLVSLSGSRSLIEEFDRRVVKLGTFYNTQRLVFDLRGADEKIDNQIHMNLLEELVREDPDYAEKVVREHLRIGKQRIFTGFQERAENSVAD